MHGVIVSFYLAHFTASLRIGNDWSCIFFRWRTIDCQAGLEADSANIRIAHVVISVLSNNFTVYNFFLPDTLTTSPAQLLRIMV
jgi:hypothetical protein